MACSRLQYIEDIVGIFCPLGANVIFGCQKKKRSKVTVISVHAVICFVFLSDCNCGERGPSKDISGFPQHPPFSFGAKNRKLRVSSSCTFSVDLKQRCFSEKGRFLPNRCGTVGINSCLSPLSGPLTQNLRDPGESLSINYLFTFHVNLAQSLHLHFWLLDALLTASHAPSDFSSVDSLQ